MTLIRKSPSGLCCYGVVCSAGRFSRRNLCDASSTNCRRTLITLIDNETQGIDIGVWFFKDYRYATALMNAKNRGVPIRVIMDPRANAQYPENKPLIDQLGRRHPDAQANGRRYLPLEADDFAGQGIVEWSGANFSPTAFVPQDPGQGLRGRGHLFLPAARSRRS